MMHGVVVADTGVSNEHGTTGRKNGRLFPMMYGVGENHHRRRFLSRRNEIFPSASSPPSLLRMGISRESLSNTEMKHLR